MAAVLGVAAAVSVSLPLATASAAGGAITNGDFEADAVGSTTATGWAFSNGLVDLGVTSLGGCVSQDTSSYSTLRDYADNAGSVQIPVIPVGSGDELLVPGTTDPVWLDALGAVTTPGAVGARQVFYGTVTDYDGTEITDFYVLDVVDDETSAYAVEDVEVLTGNYDFSGGFYDDVYPDYRATPDPAVRADDVPAATDSTYWGDTEFSSEVVDPDTARDSDFAPSSKALELFSDMDADSEGYVAHGPAAVSDPFTTTGSRTVTLDWAASGASDDYHVLGYALNVNTCQQIEVLDSTGEESDWQSTSVSLPNAGTYRFVFVAGTYDQSWGGAAGAVLYVDNVRVVPTITGTGLDLEPLFGLGDPVASAPIQLTGGGLLPNSPWTAELHSTPVVLASGVTDASGNFWMLSALPATVEAGQHQIILTGTNPDGTPRVATAWITVTASGSIGYLSLVAADGGGTGGTGGTAGVVSGPTDTAPATATGQALAYTGFDPSVGLALGVGLLAIGGVALLAARRLSRRS